MTEIEILRLLLGFVVCLLIISHGRGLYWKGKYEESEDSGWIDEALFWRHHFDAKSAIWVDSDGEKDNLEETF